MKSNTTENIKKKLFVQKSTHYIYYSSLLSKLSFVMKKRVGVVLEKLEDMCCAMLVKDLFCLSHLSKR